MADNAPVLGVPVTDIILRRRSWRKYDGNPLSPADREKLSRFLADPPAPPFGSSPRFILVEADSSSMGRVPGTYGMIQGAKNFLVGAMDHGPWDMEDFGYVFEAVVLYATAMGLGTCWMGASIRRGIFAEKAKLSREEIIPAISPVGYNTQRRGFTDVVARASIGAAKRKPWDQLFFEGDFSRPLTKAAAGEWAEPLEMVRLGPSATNKQPWRIVLENGKAHLYLQRTTGYDKMTKQADMQRLDMGIAMCHLELTAREKGLNGSWKKAQPEINGLPAKTEYIASFLP